MSRSVTKQSSVNLQGAVTASEKKRARGHLGDHFYPMPNTGRSLLEMQLHSYEELLYTGKDPQKRKDSLLFKALTSHFPIISPSKNLELHCEDYRLEMPELSVNECKMKGLSYAAILRVKFRLVIYDLEKGEKGKIKQVKEQEEVYMGEIPLMTDVGSFIVNGTERMVVAQLHRSPGVAFEHDRGRTHSSGKVLHTAKIIPYRGAWLDFEMDVKGHMFARIDRKRKIPATVILYALGLSKEEILRQFYEPLTIKLNKKGAKFPVHDDALAASIAFADIKDKQGKVIIASGRRITMRHVKLIKKAGFESLDVPFEFLEGRVNLSPIVDPKTGEILVHENSILDLETIESLVDAGIRSFDVIDSSELNKGSYIADTLRLNGNMSREEALIEIYRVMRPGEPPTRDAAEGLFSSLFFSDARYDLSAVGRMKINRRLNIQDDERSMTTLTKEDIIDVLLELVRICDGKSDVDDIDNLSNRRVRSVGEMIENQVRSGLSRLERSVRERLGQPDIDELTPQDLVNARAISSSIKEFFGSSQLSQFKDGVNPLAGLTHGRRVSALGPGGLTRDRAGFEVRDVHPTHYSRLCPIETPEGPNIGLINSLAILARVNHFGFIESPYFKVIDGRVTDEMVYLSAIEEGQYVIAQATAKRDAKGLLQESVLTCRYKGDSLVMPLERVDYIDIIPNQMISVAASLVPFLEHNDANRALMGANMQRQAVPLIQSEKPLVGTGVERMTATHSGVNVIAKRSGVVAFVDASRIVVRVDADQVEPGEPVVDIYTFTKNLRSNHNTWVNQKPIVHAGDRIIVGDVLADGTCSDLGELALGRNMLVAFMPWNGCNFEDSIVLSERVVRSDTFTSVHIYEYTCTARDTKLGEEEITSDIPNIGDDALSKLDASGIAYIGAEVEPGDILVGKVTPKGETQMSPEEKLLHAIFGEKAANVKDTSLRVPPGTSGTVVDVQILSRDGAEKSERALSIEHEAMAKVKQNLADELRFSEEALMDSMKDFLLDKALVKGPKDGPKAVKKISKTYLDALTKEQLCALELSSEHQAVYKKFVDGLTQARVQFEEELAKKKTQIQQADDLSPGVIKIIKVYLAVKRRIQPGDKLAGRHGNKGIISAIVPIEDMPCLTDGTPVDVVLNPLGVPSRMNIGQVMETHLGWAAKRLGIKFGQMLDDGRPVKEIRGLLSDIYCISEFGSIDLKAASDEEIMEMAKHLRDGVPFASPVFNGASEAKIKSLLELAGEETDGKSQLIDGRTGQKIHNRVTVGYMYMLKLNHLIDDKMHSRSTGSYSLVTQQPLGGKAQFGGQRFGEMEVWALQAYGAAYTLQEILTVKSDDINGRTRMYRNIVDGKHVMDASVPEAFNVLVKEIQALGIDMRLVSPEKE